MSVIRVDTTKHPHPNRYRRALVRCLLGVVAGIAMTVFGVFVIFWDRTGWRAWLAALIILGPTVVFLSAIAFATYLEGLETERYGGVYEQLPAAEGPAPPS